MSVDVTTLNSEGGADALRNVLAEHGIAIVTNVLSPTECLEAEERWRNDLVDLVDQHELANAPHCQKVFRQLTRQNAADAIKAWPEGCDEAIGMAKRGFAGLRGLPHGEFAWQCRLHPVVRDAFAAAHNVSVDDLSVGCDSVFWSNPNCAKADSNNEWLHCDQNHNTGLTWPIFQGLLYIWPSGKPRASTTVVWPGSHKAEVYGRMMADPYAVEKGTSSGGQLIKTNMLQSDDGRALHTEAVLGARRVPMPPGSLLLWDSRTIHQGWSGGPRLAVPVCWEPRDRRSEQALRRKFWMAATGTFSTHSSTEGRVHSLAAKAPESKIAASQESEFLRLPLKAGLVPFSVDPTMVEQWRDALPKLWAGSRHDRSSRLIADKADVDLITPLLRQEVAQVL